MRELSVFHPNDNLHLVSAHEDQMVHPSSAIVFRTRGSQDTHTTVLSGHGQTVGLLVHRGDAGTRSLDDSPQARWERGP